MPGTLNILYLVHDLSDAAVARRVSMLRDGGATVKLMGFRRGHLAPDPGDGTAIDLGQTLNGRFLQRIWSVLRVILGLGQYRSLFAAADLVLARNLEMLAIGVRGRAFCSRKPALVYECLDIHRLLLNRGLAGQGLRALEGWLSQRTSALITSSPAFISDYFQKISRVRLPIRLVENKVYCPPDVTKLPPRPDGPPWRIGWFGAIRCRESLRILKDLVKSSGGNVQVVIRGRPALDQFEDFEQETSGIPGLQFLGPYANPADLVTIYRDVHFTWAIDKFEAGLNSSWLLPNRLYEGCLFAAVPLAEKSVASGRFIDRLKIGVCLDEPLETSLAAFFRTLTATRYRELESDIGKIPDEVWMYSQQDCRDLVDYLTALPC
jgi:succinoglycan biosynthesis protein ExoL